MQDGKPVAYMSVSNTQERLKNKIVYKWELRAHGHSQAKVDVLDILQRIPIISVFDYRGAD